jgi:cold-inducible RNA-binding protein
MGKRLYVGNLPYDADEESIRAAFAEDGRSVARVHIPLDRETNRPRGFAFVEMASDADAQKALEAMNGAMFGTRQLRVSEAEDRRPGGPGGGGGGGGGYGGPRPSGPRPAGAGPSGPRPAGAYGGGGGARPAGGGARPTDERGDDGSRPRGAEDDRPRFGPDARPKRERERDYDKRGHGRRRHDTDDEFGGGRRGRNFDDDDE